jgi:hypothetical protein
VPIDLPEPPKLRERILAVDLAVVATVTDLSKIETAEGFEGPRVAGVFEVEVERVLLGEPPEKRVLVRVLGDGAPDEPTWTSDLRPGARLLLLLSRDVAPELPENLFAPYFSSAFSIDDTNRVAFPANVLDDVSRRGLRPTRGRAPLDRVQKLVETLTRERADRERELEALIPPKRVRRYPEVQELPGAVVPAEGPVGPSGPVFEPEIDGGRPAKPEKAPDT